jgi:transposase
MDASEILRRHHDGQPIAHIARVSGYDRKTIRKYLARDAERRTVSLATDHQFAQVPQDILPELHGRPATKQKLLEPYLTEITELITTPSNPLKAKSAYEVLCARHELSGSVSYSSFKRFVRTNRIIVFPGRTTCRLEVEPGSQVQVDYCNVGLLFDPLTQKRRTVHAFIGSLSFSRHKFVELTFRQNQQSFVNSHVKMFHAFGGVSKIITIDNLKAGVITPDLYDPKLNRAYQEMAEHYHCFIDPCRVATPQDKGKVERDVQTIREQFRKLIALNPPITIDEANIAINTWLRHEYGKRKHGTTHQEPFTLFTQIEQPMLLPLPLEPYEAALWKEATVHPDHYIQVDKKAYSIPHPYVGKKVWVKVTHTLVQVYYNDQLIKQHLIGTGYRHTDFNDFPDNVRHALDTGMAAYLCEKAALVGKNFETLIRTILSIHAFINLRKAQGIVALIRQYPTEIIEQASETAVKLCPSLSPKLFKSLLEKLQYRTDDTKQLSLSDETQSFIRDKNYFTNNQ